ncbi:uncharacterized protein LOC126298281 [Schistocerca gregaria]|uniref:uncharacterized protein LOC126298281 n=1 Tax=Schistocerca gregaria TaxID=7010 RepID=UPI00211DFBFB|nr:uncharacterized protein LOC126298281 [Schistocerca gregaria]
MVEAEDQRIPDHARREPVQKHRTKRNSLSARWKQKTSGYQTTDHGRREPVQKHRTKRNSLSARWKQKTSGYQTTRGGSRCRSTAQRGKASGHGGSRRPADTRPRKEGAGAEAPHNEEQRQCTVEAEDQRIPDHARREPVQKHSTKRKSLSAWWKQKTSGYQTTQGGSGCRSTAQRGTASVHSGSRRPADTRPQTTGGGRRCRSTAQRGTASVHGGSRRPADTGPREEGAGAEAQHKEEKPQGMVEAEDQRIPDHARREPVQKHRTMRNSVSARWKQKTSGYQTTRGGSRCRSTAQRGKASVHGGSRRPADTRPRKEEAGAEAPHKEEQRQCTVEAEDQRIPDHRLRVEEGGAEAPPKRNRVSAQWKQKTSGYRTTRGGSRCRSTAQRGTASVHVGSRRPADTRPPDHRPREEGAGAEAPHKEEQRQCMVEAEDQRIPDHARREPVQKHRTKRNSLSAQWKQKTSGYRTTRGGIRCRSTAQRGTASVHGGSRRPADTRPREEGVGAEAPHKEEQRQCTVEAEDQRITDNARREPVQKHSTKRKSLSAWWKQKTSG